MASRFGGFPFCWVAFSFLLCLLDAKGKVQEEEKGGGGRKGEILKEEGESKGKRTIYEGMSPSLSLPSPSS